ncbi:MAG TPA: PHP domain-containing protein, partial [Chthoniobacterales bacterium]
MSTIIAADCIEEFLARPTKVEAENQLPVGILVGGFHFLDNLQFMSVKIDLHCHSFFSGDGVSSPEQLIEAARRKSLNAFVITDHNTCDAITYLT